MNTTSLTSEGRALTQRVLACESAAVDTGTPAAFRACEKLRRPLSTLLGALGYRALLMRALTLAKRESPALESVRIKNDGSLEELDAQALTAGATLIDHLIGLLLSFVGEAVTLRLLHDVWPALGRLNSTAGEPE